MGGWSTRKRRQLDKHYIPALKSISRITSRIHGTGDKWGMLGIEDFLSLAKSDVRVNLPGMIRQQNICDGQILEVG